jgi:hypothetical protein
MRLTMKVLAVAVAAALILVSGSLVAMDSAVASTVMDSATTDR